MERVGRTVLRYGLSHRSFENEASSSATEKRLESVKNSDEDVDFDDMFGGPPTRMRYSFGGGRIMSSEESTTSPVGLGERPVFGESYSSPRKWTSDDFYNVIFRRSNESVRSSSSDFRFCFNSLYSFRPKIIVHLSIFIYPKVIFQSIKKLLNSVKVARLLYVTRCND